MAKVRLLNGKPLMVGGKVALSDDCCCAGQCPDCPAGSVTVTFNSLSICAGCIPVVLNGVSYVVGGSIDGSYLLPVHASAGGVCCYEGLFIGPSVDDYLDTTCTVLDTPEIWTLFIRVGRYSPMSIDPDEPACQWAVYAWIEGAGGDQLVAFVGPPQASFSSPFNNSTICGGGPGTAHNPCESEAWNAVAYHAGTASLSL